jgi:hypothetical protein
VRAKEWVWERVRVRVYFDKTSLHFETPHLDPLLSARGEAKEARD